MNRTRRTLRQTLTIARRDFVATVFTPTFLIFLLAPLIMLSFGAIGGLGAATMADSSTDRIKLVALAGDGDGARLLRADRDLRRIFRESEAPPRLEIRPTSVDPAQQARALFNDEDIEVSAVLYGPLERPTVLHGVAGERTGTYMATLAEQALRNERAGTAERLSNATIRPFERERATRSGQQAAGFGAVFVIFFLTLLLAGQTVGMLAEERNNKVIEVLAAAVPLEAVFFGKLLGMFGVAILFVGFWGTLITQGAALLPGDVANALGAVTPAIGILPFALVYLTYFALAFLLLGAVFLGVGAQAATMREIQMLSLPITIFQVAMFGLSAAAASSPGTGLATFAEIFPFSSPFAMAARAASSPEIWPHLLAIAWQALWLAITISIGARAFRRGVLQSGSGGKMKLSSLIGRG
ncbi:ABC transporter permease [Sphingomonas gilva]|uniref:ABC transporter permease n=1 Tax=Sphingomonas gilva TaxID=2305907 RepID=A0A396RQV2_9SPHN|nr:ABC transporter permease [Sphingomonas gilva]RHW19017.1 ABC transporter permease [Sphingomonas gilva]